jgi:hypothetical protein
MSKSFRKEEDSDGRGQKSDETFGIAFQLRSCKQRRPSKLERNDYFEFHSFESFAAKTFA